MKININVLVHVIAGSAVQVAIITALPESHVKNIIQAVFAVIAAIVGVYDTSIAKLQATAQPEVPPTNP